MIFNGQDVQDYVVSLRRTIHERPELGLKEYETSRLIQDELTKLNIPFKLFGDTAVIAEIQGEKEGNGGCVALRADMDALPIQEESDLEYASKNQNVMHACGHDAHTAMLLGAARLLSENRRCFCGRVRLIFEPAEEFGGAGDQIVAAGYLNDAETVFAIHVMPDLAAGKISVEAGPRMAGIGGLKAVFHGKGGHAALPHQNTDCVLAAAEALVSLQAFVSREIDANDAVVVSVPYFHAGTAGNIMPETAEFRGCVRYFDQALEPKISEGIKRIISRTAEAFRIEAEVSVSFVGPPCITDAACSVIAAEAARKVMGESAISLKRQVPTSDDYGVYLQKVPGVYAFLGVGNQEKGAVYPLHSPKFRLDEDVLGAGSAVMAQYVLDFLEK